MIFSESISTNLLEMRTIKMKYNLLASLAISLAIPAVAFAGTCAAPTPINQAPNSTFSGTTCGGEVGIPFGGAVSPHPSNVFSFVYNSGAGNLTVVGAEREVIIAASCATLPLGGFAPGVPVDVSTLGLTNGTTYIMAVGSDSGLPVTAPPRCGNFDVSFVTLPVELQNFSVE
jgi:hypothetical protein